MPTITEGGSPKRTTDPAIRLYRNGSGPDEQDPGRGKAPHDTKPMPGIDPNIGAAAAERLYDPDQMRAIAFAFGQTMHMISARYLVDGGEVEQLYAALGAIRKGAVKQQGERQLGDLLVTARTAPLRARTEAARGEADGARADRLATAVRPELERLVEDRSKTVAAAAAVVQQREDELEEATKEEGARRRDLPPDERPGPQDRPGEPDPRGAAGLFERVSLGRKGLAIVAPAELTVTTVLLQGPISDLVATTTPLDSYLIALGVSGTLLGLGFVGGFAAAALRLSARVAAAVILVLAGVLVYKAGHAMDLVRAGDEEGVALLTTSTLATILIAGVTTYAQTRYKAHQVTLPDPKPESEEEVVELRLPVEHVLAVPVRRRDRARHELNEARAALLSAESDLVTLDELIERLHTSLDEAPLRVLGEETAAVEALARAATVEATTNTALAQEEASLRASIAAFVVAHRAIRATRYPEEGEPAPVATVDAWGAEESGGMGPLRRIALVVLAAGAVIGLVVPSIVAAGVGAVLAGLLWIWPPQRRGRLDRGRGTPVPTGPATSTRPVTGPAEEEWREQPSSTTGKYERGDTPPTNEV